MNNIKTPENWRKGQTVFNFLEWLAANKGYPYNQSMRMVDPFHIPDKEWDKLVEEFNKEM